MSTPRQDDDPVYSGKNVQSPKYFDALRTILHAGSITTILGMATAEVHRVLELQHQDGKAVRFNVQEEARIVIIEDMKLMTKCSIQPTLIQLTLVLQETSAIQRWINKKSDIACATMEVHKFIVKHDFKYMSLIVRDYQAK